MGAVTGQFPVPSLPSERNQSLFWRRKDDKIKRKLHQVLVSDKTREVRSRKLQTAQRRWGRVGERRAGPEHDGLIQRSREKGVRDLRSCG